MKKQIQDTIEVQLKVITDRELSDDAKEAEVHRYLKHIGCGNIEVHLMGGMGMVVGFSVEGMELSDVMSYSDYMLTCKVREADECNCDDYKCGKALPTLQEVREVLQATLELDMEIFSTSVEAGMNIEKIMEDAVGKHAKAEEFLELAKPLIALKKAMSK